MCFVDKERAFYIATFLQLSVCIESCVFPEDSFIKLSNGSIIQKFKKLMPWKLSEFLLRTRLLMQNQEELSYPQTQSPSLCPLTGHGYLLYETDYYTQSLSLLPVAPTTFIACLFYRTYYTDYNFCQSDSCTSIYYSFLCHFETY